MAGIAPPQRPGFHWVYGKGYVPDKAGPAAGTSPAQQRAVNALTKSTTLHDSNGQPAVAGEQPGRKPLNVKQLQMALQEAGYDLKADGKLGPTTKSALADFLKVGPGHSISDTLANALQGTTITGRRDPRTWNQRFGSGSSRSKSFKTPGSVLDTSGNDLTAQDPSNYGAAPTGSIDFGGLMKMAASTGTPISEALANSGADMLDPRLADMLAGLQYDSAIKDARLAGEKQTRDAAQSKRDISNWYGQVQKSLGTAATRDAAINDAAVSSVGDLSQSILGSLGGAANEGSGVVGAAGTEAVGTLGALGSAQEQYNSDLAPLLQSEQAGASARDAALSSHNALALAQRLSDLQTEKGQTQAEKLLAIEQANNGTKDARVQRLLAIKGANNGLKQQEFQNNLALNAAQQSALLTGAKILGIGSTTKPSKVDLGKATDYVARVVGTNGTRMLPRGTHLPYVVSTIKSYLQSRGITPGDPIYGRAAAQVFTTFTDAKGRPLQWNSAWSNT